SLLFERALGISKALAKHRQTIGLLSGALLLAIGVLLMIGVWSAGMNNLGTVISTYVAVVVPAERTSPGAHPHRADATASATVRRCCRLVWRKAARAASALNSALRRTSRERGGADAAPWRDRG